MIIRFSYPWTLDLCWFKMLLNITSSTARLLSLHADVTEHALFKLPVISDRQPTVHCVPGIFSKYKINKNRRKSIGQRGHVFFPYPRRIWDYCQLWQRYDTSVAKGALSKGPGYEADVGHTRWLLYAYKFYRLHLHLWMNTANLMKIDENLFH